MAKESVGYGGPRFYYQTSNLRTMRQSARSSKVEGQSSLRKPRWGTDFKFSQITIHGDRTQDCFGANNVSSARFGDGEMISLVQY